MRCAPLLVGALLAACKGKGDKPESVPLTPPVSPADAATSATVDAATPSSSSASCFTIPFDGSAETAGIRRLAHRIPPLANAAQRVGNVVVLPVDKRAPVPGLQAPDNEPLRTFGLGADALATMAQVDPKNPKNVTTVAPAHLEGAVMHVRGATSVLVAVGDAGVATLARYREHYVKRRIADKSAPISALEPYAIIYDDLDADGTLELISFSRTTPARDPSMVELGVLFSTGEIGFAPICCGDSVLGVWVVPPTLSGGKTLLFDLVGDRVTVGNKQVETLPRTQVGGGGVCLQTSATKPAELAPRP
jgi:hypothetical protein